MSSRTRFFLLGSLAAAVFLIVAWATSPPSSAGGALAPSTQQPGDDTPPTGEEKPSAERGGGEGDEPEAPETAAEPDLNADVPYELRVELEVPLNKKVDEIRARTNDDGIHNERANYMKRFVKVDDNTYHVVLHRNIAGKQDLTTERYLLTLKRAPGATKWEIGEEKLERTVKDFLFRSVPHDETFRAFDSFSIEREGLTVSGGPGTLIVDYWKGRPDSMGFVAQGMRYDYQPPQDLSYYQISRVLKNLDKYKGDLMFEPEAVYIFCQADECERFLAESFKGLRDTTEDQLDPLLHNRYKDYVKDEDDARRERPMSGFRAELWPERRNYTVALKRKGGAEHWARLSYDSLDPEEVSFYLTRLGEWPLYGFPLFTYYSEATRRSGASPSDLERRPDADGLAYDLLAVQGDVDMSVEDASTMRCDLTFRLKVKKPFQALPIFISQLRDVPGAKSDAKRPTMSIHFIEDGAHQELTYIPLGGSFGYAVLPSPAKAGEELTFRVKFTNANAVYKLNPSYSYVARGGWLPFVRFGDLIDNFDLRIRVPRRYEILGVGYPASNRIEGDYRVAQFTTDSPVTFPTIIFGDYESAKPKFQAKKIDGTEIPVTVYVDKTSTMQFSQWKSVEDVRSEVGSGINEIRTNSLRGLAEQAANSLNLYREVYGVDYPYRKLDLVNDPVGPGFYGQAPASIVYLGAGVFRATGTVAHFGGTEISKFKESVVAHEVGHQWWGSLITMSNGRHYWFVESLAEYSSALFVENLYASTKGPEAGRKAYLDKVEEWRRVILEAGSMAAVSDVDTMWSGGQFPGQARTAAIYNQGPYAFHVLRETFGDDKFFAFLKRLATELRNKEITTLDIQRVAEESFGGTMQWFFDQWINGVGLPEYAIQWKTRMAEDGTHIVEGEIRQRILLGLEKTPLPGKTFRGMMTITVVGSDKKEYPVRLLVEKEVTPFAFKVPVKPREVILNKNGGMLAYDVVANTTSR